MKVEAGKYDQIGFFRAVLENEHVLFNIQSDSGSKSGETITVTIEGDLQ